MPNCRRTRTNSLAALALCIALAGRPLRWLITHLAGPRLRAKASPLFPTR